MYFKPRVFISSIMKDALEQREAICKSLEECGAEVLLYEKNLTPSANKNTYRDDILEADFVIVILGEKYGALTENGVSGTEEEIAIALQHGLKTHFYLKNAKKHSKKEKELEKWIRESGISYYYYDSDEELIYRIKSSVMTIAKEITINSIDAGSFEEKKLFRLAQDHDYKQALMFIERHETMVKYCRTLDVSTHFTDIVSAFTETPYHWLSKNQHIFIDPKYRELLLKAYEVADEYNSKHGCDYSFSEKLNSPIAVISEENWGGISIHYLRKTNPHADDEWYTQKFKEYMELFEEFKQYVKNQRLEIDSIP